MNKKANLFSRLPKVDDIISFIEQEMNLLDEVPREVVVESIREEIDNLRIKIANGSLDTDGLNSKVEDLPILVSKRARKKVSYRLKRVINASGVVIHTNLGRSLIDNEVMENISEVVSNYSNLEFDLDTGKRGSRYSHLIDIITRVTGAEDALVVNNNAAAVMLVLSSLAKDKEVIVSRGELVEIGGSFRVPDVMEQSGAKLVDVGTTNKTHLWDYERALSEDTSAFLKVHTSNYRILGFTSEVKLDELVELGKKHSIPVVEDLGSGVLIDLSKYGLEYEPTVQDSMKAGVDIITFSGDKLLGGPQAGVIIGKKKLIDIMKKHPLNRAFRIDKFTIAALEATLRFYLDEDEAIRKIPTLRMITMPLEELERRGNELLNLLKGKLDDSFSVGLEDQYSQVGGGSMPLEQIPTKTITISSQEGKITKLENSLREYDIPVIARIYKDKMYLDLRTIKEEEFKTLVGAFEYAAERV
ncbi:L-seryl-tRNA(Sec) selenium transferase [Sporosalibacterium faouarense]|uniref:L-seryl-tRNA(Sec) selenium transferase n=1 Tax=Sporosalibacterium faouarense TaxID=516123 RepID=UPI00141C0FB2|nr:L-seryl-tRNA(Sec) selenium transferase [Sporosalibacterium faouarense]MTI48483.1 L-seryl-tRNA(Sec) selenium transferase [Bacillota bacterium]